MSDQIVLFLARYFWIGGKPRRTGSFLVQYEDGTVKFLWWMVGSPQGELEPVVYWRRANAPLPPPLQYLSYHATANRGIGITMSSVRDYY